MDKTTTVRLPKVIFTHNMIFLFFFFITPKFYLFDEFGLRGEDLLFPFTFFLFLAALPELGKLNISGLNKIIFAYFAFIFIQGFILGPLTGAFKYFIVISFKQLQYFIFFYMLLYTLRFPKLKEKTMRFTAILVGANVLWALFQAASGQRAYYSRSPDEVWAAYGAGGIGEGQPHQAASIFLFGFIFFYLYRNFKYRKIFIALSAVAVFATVSRTTIAALGVCALYIFFNNPRVKAAIKKPAIIIPVLTSVFLLLYTADAFLTSTQLSAYGTLKARMSLTDLLRGFFLRLANWTHDLSYESYIVYNKISFLTGMGRGYANTLFDTFRLQAHSGYVRDFMEIGFIGLLLHLGIFFTAGKYIGFKKYSVVLLPFLALCVTNEIFLVAKSGHAILFLTAVLLSGSQCLKTNSRPAYGNNRMESDFTRPQRGAQSNT